jgi:hypothetical protein
LVGGSTPPGASIANPSPRFSALDYRHDTGRKIQRAQADRNSLLSFFALNSARWAEIGIVLTGSLRAAAVRLHNQNMKSTVVNPNESHPNRKI